MKRICTRCPYNGLSSDECIACAMEDSCEDYAYRYQKYILEGYDVPQSEPQEQMKCTELSEDEEDNLRKLLYKIFDLSPNELLCLQAIMNNKDLTTFAKEMEQLANRNKCFTRFRAFQTRKAIIKKHPELAIACLTNGQRKELKK